MRDEYSHIPCIVKLALLLHKYTECIYLPLVTARHGADRTSERGAVSQLTRPCPISVRCQANRAPRNVPAAVTTSGHCAGPRRLQVMSGSRRQRRRRHRDDGHRRSTVVPRRAACDASRKDAPPPTSCTTYNALARVKHGAPPRPAHFLRTVGCPFSECGVRAWRRINERDRVTGGVTHTLQSRVKTPFVAHSLNARCLGA